MPIVQQSRISGVRKVETAFAPDADVVRGVDYNPAVTDIANIIAALNALQPSAGILVATADGTVADPAMQIGSAENGIYQVSSTQLGFSIGDTLTALVDSDGIAADSTRLRISVGTPGTGVTAVHYGDGKDITTVLTLTAVSLGAPTAGASEAVGALIYTFPAGSHVHYVTSFDLGLTIGTVQTDTPDVGIGSVIASGAVATLNGTPTFEDYVTGQTWAVALDGTTQAAGPIGATAGVLTGISLNNAAATKTVHLNAADGWNAGITGDLTADGTVIIRWTIM